MIHVHYTGNSQVHTKYTLDFHISLMWLDPPPPLLADSLRLLPCTCVLISVSLFKCESYSLKEQYTAGVASGRIIKACRHVGAQRTRVKVKTIEY